MRTLIIEFSGKRILLRFYDTLNIFRKEMDIPVKDRSNYLKGLLIIAKKDNQIAENEKAIIKNIAMRLGFASDFYDETIRTLLANKYINEEVIIFSDQVIARSFIADGLRLAFSDENISPVEIEWLKQIALANNLSEEWFLEEAASKKKGSHSVEYALYSII